MLDQTFVWLDDETVTTAKNTLLLASCLGPSDYIHMPLSVDPFKGSSRLNTDLDADGDGIITEEEWAAERASRGMAGMTTVTTKFQLAQDYPGSTVKNKLGPRNPLQPNTPFSNVALPEEPKVESQNYWTGKSHAHLSAAELFELELEAKRRRCGA